MGTETETEIDEITKMEIEIDEIFERVRKYFALEDRKNLEFRALISFTELLDVTKYITHDQELNPGARVYGTREDEVLAYGQALVQLFALMDLRNIDFREAARAGLKNWADKDWRKKKGSFKKLNNNIITLEGTRASSGKRDGMAVVVSSLSEKKMQQVSKKYKNQEIILVVDSLTPQFTEYYQAINLIALVTNQGGGTSHGAIIARELLKIPCVSGTEVATKKIKTGDNVVVNGDTGQVIVIKQQAKQKKEKKK